MIKEIRHSKARHPQTNGVVERLNQTIKERISNAMAEDDLDWDQVMDSTIHTYNRTYHSTIGTTPYSLFFARPYIWEKSNDVSK